MDIRGKNLLVIGGAGDWFAHGGQALVRGCWVGHDLNNFTRGPEENLTDAFKDPRVSLYEIGGDILQSDILDSAMNKRKIDGVFHFAALWLLQCHDFPRSAFNTNVAGTFNVMEACVKNNIQRLVWSSPHLCTATRSPNYGRRSPVQQQNFYGATKIAGEAMLRSFHHRYGRIYRLTLHERYGYRQDYHGAYIAVIMKMLDAIDRGEAPTIMGDGSEAFDFVAVEDCAKANVCGMTANATDEFYNVGTGKRTSLKELAEKLLNLTGCNKEIQYAPRSQATLVKNRIGSPVKNPRD